jgi:hypothetical protein
MFGGVTNNFDFFNYDQEMVGREDDGLGNEFLPAYGITEQDILNYFNTPGLTPQQAVATMQQYGIEPESIAGILGITPADARAQYTAALAAAPTTAAPAAVTPPATTTPPAATTPPADSNIVMDAVREVGKVFDAGLKAFGDLIGGFDLSAVIFNPVNPQATVVFGPPSGSPVTVIGNMPTSKAPIGVNTGVPALDALIGVIFAGKNNNRPLGEVIWDSVEVAVGEAAGLSKEQVGALTEAAGVDLKDLAEKAGKVIKTIETNVAEVEAVQRPAIIVDWYDKNKDLSDSEIATVMDENGVTPEEMAAAIGEDPAEVKRRYDESKVLKETLPTEVDSTPPPLAPTGSPGPSGSETDPNLVRIGDPDAPLLGPVRVNPPVTPPVVTPPVVTPPIVTPPVTPVTPELPIEEEFEELFPVTPVTPEVPVRVNPPVTPVTPEVPVRVNPPVTLVTPEVPVRVNPPVTPVTPEVPVRVNPPVTPVTPEVPPVIKLPDDPFTPDPEVIVHPDEVPPIIKTPDEPDYTSVIGGALGGLFGAITPTPITDSIFAPEKVKFNRLPLDITNTLFGGFRR